MIKKTSLIIFLIVIGLAIIGLILVNFYLNKRLTANTSSLLNATATPTSQTELVSPPNPLTPLKPITNVSDTDAVDAYVQEYPAQLDDQGKIKVNGFYVNLISSGSAERQLFVYGILTEWNYQDQVLKIQTGHGMVELKSDPSGVFFPPKSANKQILAENVASFIDKRVTAWITVVNGLLYTNQVTITQYR